MKQLIFTIIFGCMVCGCAKEAVITPPPLEHPVYIEPDNRLCRCPPYCKKVSRGVCTK